MKTHDMSHQPFGWSGPYIPKKAKEIQFNYGEKVGVQPTKVVPVGGAISDKDGFNIIEIFFFLFTKSSIRIGVVDPKRINTPRTRRDSTGLYYGKLDLISESATYINEQEAKEFRDGKTPRKLEKENDEDESLGDGIVLFPSLIISISSVFKQAYGSKSANYFDIFFATNLLNNHVCLYETIDGGIVALPYN